MMTDAQWARTLSRLDENEAVIRAMTPTDPAPSANWCRESAHRTLGHLTACQAAWICLLRDGSLPIRPDPLFTKLSFATTPWAVLLERFVAERSEWRKILASEDASRQIRTPTQVTSPQNLTKRMVDHEWRHLNDLLAHSEVS